MLSKDFLIPLFKRTLKSEVFEVVHQTTQCAAFQCQNWQPVAIRPDTVDGRARGERAAWHSRGWWGT